MPATRRITLVKIVILVFTVATILFAVFVPDNVAAKVLAAFAVLIAIAMWVTPISDLISLAGREGQSPIRFRRAHAISDETRYKNRMDMLRLVYRIWIKGYLDPVLNEMKSLKLDLKFIEPEKVLQRPGMEDYKLPDSSAICRIFDDFNRHLVILGEPGAGKTVLLLQLARRLMAEARADPTGKKPIPIVLALSSWAAIQLPVEDWLRRELREKYGLSPKVADDLVKGEQLLYLLDGLDEVAESRRDACLKAIKEFVEARPVRYVLCSRRAEFLQLPTRLDVPGEILLQPLSPAQAAAYLGGDDFDGLRTVMDRGEYAILREFARIPFMLNTMAFVTRGVKEPNIRFEIDDFDSPAHLRDYFLENYLNRRLQEQPDPHHTNFAQTRNWLRWLAQQLIEHDETDFYIENLQPTWLDSPIQRRRFLRVVRLTVMLLVGLIMLVGGLVGGLAAGLAFGLVVGLLVELVVELAGWRSGKMNIEVSDRLFWEFSRVKLMFGMAFGLVVGLLVGLPTGMAFGLVVGLALGLALGFNTRETILLRLRPNEGIRRSLGNALRVWFIVSFGFWLAFGLAFGLVGGLAFGLWFGLAFGLSFALQHGGTAVLRHTILRGFLSSSGHIPRWRYDRFLDYAAQLVILRKVGGGYRFVHDYLRQYLASAAFVPDAVHHATMDD